MLTVHLLNVKIMHNFIYKFITKRNMETELLDFYTIALATTLNFKNIDLKA